MLAKYLVLVLLPAIAYSRISIKVLPSENGQDPEIRFSGEDIITDLTPQDIKVFKLDDRTLKRAAQKAFGESCSDVYLTPKTPFGDVFEKYHWTPVRKIVRPIQATVLGINTKPTAFGNAEYVNNHEKLDVTYSTSLTHEVEETVSHSWTRGAEVGIGVAIDYSVSLGVLSAGGSTSLSYTASFGEETSKSRSVTLGSTSTISTVVPPKTKVVASLFTSHGTMQIHVVYESYIEGKVFCNYAKQYKNHHFYGMDIDRLLGSLDIPLDRNSIEEINIGYYTNARLEVNNANLDDD